MNEFTASNGRVIRRSEEPFAGGSHVSLGFGASGRDGTFLMTGQQEEALREFFRAEDDKRLGRWRWPENPDYVAYPDGTSRRVLRESTGHMMVISLHDRKVMETSLDSYVGAARAFDDAHPEPKPWHDAKPGEVWALTTDDVADEVAARVANLNDEVVFEYVSSITTRCGVTDSRFTSGRRIWPEVAS